MADSTVAVTAGTGTNIDTRTEATNGHHRQVVVLGDPSVNAGVAPVDATNGLTVDLGTNNDVTVTGTVTANLSATDNAVLDSIDGKIPALGQALAGASVPVILPAATITTLTPPAAITGFATEAKQLPDGHNVTVDNSTGAAAVNIQDGGNTITVDGTVAVTNSDITSIKTAVEILDNTVAGTEMQVDVVGSLPAGTALLGKVGIDQVTANANEVVTKTGSVTTATLSAETTKVIGTVNVAAAQTIAATQSGTWDEVGINDSGNSITVDNATISVVGGGTEATAQRVTIASDSTGVLSVDDNGGALTVDGTVTANAGTNLNTSALALETGGNLAAVATSLGNLDNSVDGNYLNVNANIAGTDIVGGAGAVAAGVQRVTLASDDPAVTSLGILDNAISGSEMQVDVVGALPAGTNAIGKLAANDGVDIGDVGIQAGTAAIGKLLPPDIDVTTHTNYARKYYTSAGAATDGIIWSPAAGKRWHVVTMYIQTSAAATVTLEDDKAGGDDPVWKGELAANGGAVLSFTEKYPMASGEDAADLIVTTSAGNIYITAVGYEI